jgi:hypothetical protein
MRRYYRLTAGGGKLLAAEAERMQTSAQVAVSRLTAAPGLAA